MFKVRRVLGLLGATVLAAATGVVITVATATTEAGAQPNCPTAGGSTGCDYVINVGIDGKVSITGPSGSSLDGGGRGEGDDVVVGVVNNSNGIVNSIWLSGQTHMFSFDGDGICTYIGLTTPGAYCATNNSGHPSYSVNRFGQLQTGHGGVNPYDYAGPNNTFTSIGAYGQSGTLSFTNPLPPQGTTYLSLEAPPTSAVAVASVSPGIVAATPVVPASAEGGSVSGQIATFTDPGSVSPADRVQRIDQLGRRQLECRHGGRLQRLLHGERLPQLHRRGDLFGHRDPSGRQPVGQQGHLLPGPGHGG